MRRERKLNKSIDECINYPSVDKLKSIIVAQFHRWTMLRKGRQTFVQYAIIILVHVFEHVAAVYVWLSKIADWRLPLVCSSWFFLLWRSVVYCLFSFGEAFGFRVHKGPGRPITAVPQSGIVVIRLPTRPWGRISETPRSNRAGWGGKENWTSR